VKGHNSILVPRVKVWIPYIHLKNAGEGRYKEFGTANGAAKMWAEAIAGRYALQLPKLTAINPDNFVVHLWDTMEYRRVHKGLFRRAKKVFKAKGLK
jgi:hypothetical protein